MSQGNPNPQIGVVESQDRAETLELVFSHLSPDDRRRHIAETRNHVSPPGIAPFDGLMGARRNGQLVGAIFSQITPGKTAVLWLPRLTPDEHPLTSNQLFAKTWEYLAWKGVVLAQSLLSTVSRSETESLQSGGFSYLANLLYLVALESDFPANTPNAQLDFQPYCSAHNHQWIETLTATYKNTLDCAGLKNVRNSEDFLAEYRSTCNFNPNLWLILRQEQRPVGCLLLADHPRHDNMELLYLGLIPEARGRGWGKRLARHAQWLARRAGRRQLAVAVDGANVPAVQTYTGVGFQLHRRRKLYVKYLFSDGIGTLGLNRFSTDAATTRQK